MTYVALTPVAPVSRYAYASNALLWALLFCWFEGHG